MNKNDMCEKIREFIERNMITFDEIRIEYDDNIFEKGYVNSIFAMRLLSYIEKNFDIVVEDKDIKLENFSSINRIKLLIEQSKGV